MADDPASLLNRYHAALARLDYDAMAQMFAPDAVYASSGVGSLTGRDAIIAAFRQYFASHVHDESLDTLLENTGPQSAKAHWRLKVRELASGRVFGRSGTETVRFDASGVIVSVVVEDEVS
jgi:ketosteroid isomerase-like protein